MEETRLFQIFWYIFATFAALTFSLIGGNKVPRHGDKPTAPPPPQPTHGGAKKDAAASPAPAVTHHQKEKDEKKTPLTKVKEKAKNLRSSFSKEARKPATKGSKDGPGKKGKDKLSTEKKPKTKEQQTDEKKAPGTPVPTPSPVPVSTPPTPAKPDDGKKQQQPYDPDPAAAPKDGGEKKKDEQNKATSDPKKESKDKKTGEERTVDKTTDQTVDKTEDQTKVAKDATVEAAEGCEKSKLPTVEDKGDIQATPAADGGTVAGDANVFQKAGTFITNSLRESKKKLRKASTPTNGPSNPTSPTTTPPNETSPGKHNKFITTLQKFKHTFDQKPGGAAQGTTSPEGAPVDQAAAGTPPPAGVVVGTLPQEPKELGKDGVVKEESHNDDEGKFKKEINVEMEGGGGKNNNVPKEEFDPDAVPTVFEQVNAPIKPLKDTPKKPKSRKPKTIRCDVVSPNVSDSKEKESTGTTGTTTRTTEDDSSKERKKHDGGGGRTKEEKEDKKGKTKEEKEDKKGKTKEEEKIKDGKPKEEKTRTSDSKEEKKE